VWVTVGSGLVASAGPTGGPGVGTPTGDARRLLPERAGWPGWLIASLVGSVGLLLAGVRVFLGHGRTVGGYMRTPPMERWGLTPTTPHRRTWRGVKMLWVGTDPKYIVVLLALLLGMTGLRAQPVTDVQSQEVVPAPSHALQAVQELLALSYPELRATGLAARAVPTPAGIVMEFADRGPAVADLVARTAPRPAQLTATLTLDTEGRVRHLVCRGAWTGLDRSRLVAGTARAGVEARLTAAKARFGAVADEDVKTEARRLLDRHGLKGVRLDSAVLQEAQGTVLWVTHGATEAGESIAVHLEPLTGKLIAFHVGGER